MAKPRPFGAVLKEVRHKARISQEDLAHEAGLHRTAVGRLERGERTPSLDTIFALARALKVRASEIVARMER